MNCLRCNAPNNEGAQFCKNCGNNMTNAPSNDMANLMSPDNLLITSLCISFFSFASILVLERSVVDWYEGSFQYIRGFLWILSNLSMILIPLSIKNTSLKIVGLILTLVMVIYWTYGNVEFMMS